MLRTRMLVFALAWITLLLGTGSARAGAPGSGSIPGVFVNVCAWGSEKGQVCDPTDTDPEPCGKAGAAACLPDWEDVPVLNGTLTLISDEQPIDNNSGAGESLGPAVTGLLEIRKKGKTYFLARTFQRAVGQNGALWPEIGGWREPADEDGSGRNEDDPDKVIDSFFGQSALAAPPCGVSCFNVLEAFTAPLREIMNEAFLLDLSGALPVLADAKLLKKNTPEEDPAGAANGRAVDAGIRGWDLGEVSRFKVKIRWAADPTP